MRRAFMLLVCCGSTLLGQEEKPVPDSQKQLPVGERPSQGQLPSFDLPEFVITGRESIDLPASEKQPFPGEHWSGLLRRPQGDSPLRERVEFGSGKIYRATAADSFVGIGRAYVSVGSYSSFLAGLQVVAPLSTFRTSADLEFRRTSGFAPSTDGTDGHARVGASTPVSLLPGILSGERVSAHGFIDSRSYFWYGSVNPSADRRVLRGGVGGRVSGSARAVSHTALSLAYESGSVRDTTSSVREGIVSLDGVVEGALFDLPASGRLNVMTGGKTGGSGGSYSVIEVSGSVKWDPIEKLSTAISAGIAAYSGETGQRRTVFLPGFSAVFRLDDTHRFTGTFAPRVVFHSLMGMTGTTPFLDATSTVRHTYDGNRGSFGFESDWGPSLRTAIELESVRSTDYPMIADTGTTGVFGVFYGETRETLLRGSVVAKLPPNHYFSAIAILRSSKSSTSGVSVPYIPSMELRMSYRHTLSERVALESQLQLLSGRQIAIAGAQKTIPGHSRLDVKGSYSALSHLEVWAAVRNVLDDDTEYWAGYREMPFTVQIGLSYTL